MKKLICIMSVFFGIAIIGNAAAGPTSTNESQRYWAYAVSCLEEVRNGVFEGEIYKVSNNTQPVVQVADDNLGFCFFIKDGVSKASLGCEPGWYNTWASWQNTKRDELFISQNMGPTLLSAGSQTMPLVMTLNYNRSIRFQIQGVLPSDSDEVWFGDCRAWRDGNYWRASVYKPWNVISTDVKIIWTNHGGWVFNVNQGSFSDVITVDIGNIDPRITAPTQVMITSLLDSSYLSDDFIKLTSCYYDQNIGCNVIAFSSDFGCEVSEITVVLNGYEQSIGQYGNYFNSTLKGVGGYFIIPLGNMQILPQTGIKIFLKDPRTGEMVYRGIDSSLIWYGDNGLGLNR